MTNTRWSCSLIRLLKKVQSLFLQQIAESDPQAFHKVIMDQARLPNSGEESTHLLKPESGILAAVLPGAQSGGVVWMSAESPHGEQHLPNSQTP